MIPDNPSFIGDTVLGKCAEEALSAKLEFLDHTVSAVCTLLTGHEYWLLRDIVLKTANETVWWLARRLERVIRSQILLLTVLSTCTISQRDDFFSHPRWKFEIRKLSQWAG